MRVGGWVGGWVRQVRAPAGRANLPLPPPPPSHTFRNPPNCHDSPPCQKEKKTTALMTMNFERGRMGRSSSWVAWYMSTRQYSAHIWVKLLTSAQ